MTEQGQGSPPATPPKEKSRWRPVRLAAIWVIVVGSAIVLFVVRPSMCKDTVAGGKVLHVCEPVGATSAPALLVLVAIVLLLLPEMSEISVTGLLTLKQRADQAEQRSLQAMQQTAEVHQQLVATRSALLNLMPPVPVDGGISSLVPPTSPDGSQDPPPPGAQGSDPAA